MAKRSTPGLNTSSMADISFLLLTFFLMTSSINTDMGISRKLPPPAPENNEDKIDIHKRNIFVVKINSHDALLFDGEIGDIKDLKTRAKDFLGNPNNLENLPEKKEVDIPMLGKYMVSKGVISLQNDRGTSYDMYIQVQNELTAAVNEMRDELSYSRFGKHYADASTDQRDAINKAIPVAISEAEPTKIGGNK